jgi:hypothetical protein
METWLGPVGFLEGLTEFSFSVPEICHCLPVQEPFEVAQEGE